MKRVWLSVFASAALAVGWVGGDGLASSSGPNADARRPAEIAALSFPDDEEIRTSWQKEQKKRHKDAKDFENAKKDNSLVEEKFDRLKNRLAVLEVAITASQEAIKKETAHQNALKSHNQAQEFIAQLKELKQEIDHYKPELDFLEDDSKKWEMVKRQLESQDLTFEKKIDLRRDADEIYGKYIEKFKEKHAEFRKSFEAKEEAYNQQLLDSEHPTP